MQEGGDSEVVAPNPEKNEGVTEEEKQAKEAPKQPEQGDTPPVSDAKKSTKVAGFSDQFKAFSKFGDIKSDGRLISLSQSDKWMKQAKVVDGKQITTTDTGIYFKKLKALKVSEGDYNKFLKELAESKKIDLREMKEKMANCGAPGLTGMAANVKATGAVERLTDTSKYTGSHKQRFDESGKGRGAAGRKDIADTSGYVTGYINKNSYDKVHPTQ